MFCKNWTKKEWLRCLLCFVIYFALILVSELPGYASPLYWVLCPVVAAFLGAGPLTCVMNMGKGIGGAAVLPVLWFVVMKLMGEFSMPLMIIGMLCLMILAEVVRGIVGYEKKSSIRAATPFLSLIVFASFLPLYFQTDAYYNGALEEMGAEYAAKIASYDSFGMFLLVLVLCVIAGTISERLSEKVLKMKDPERPIFLHN